MKVTDLQLGSQIREVIQNTRGLNMSYVSKQIGMTQAGFSKSLEKDSLKVLDFLKLCAILEKPLNYFIAGNPSLDEDGNLIIIKEEQEVQIEENDLLSSKEETIKVLKDFNEQLKAENQRLKSLLPEEKETE